MSSSAANSRSARAKQIEKLVTTALLFCALVSIITTFGIIYVLISEGLVFFRHESLFGFLTGTVWTPLFEPRSFGVLPLVYGTVMVAAGACFVAVPLGLGIAVFLSEYAPPGLRRLLKPVIELLAGIPSVVFGYFALTTITPTLRAILPGVEVFNAASASIVIGIMVLPLIASLCDDVLRSVPDSLRNGGYALGATKLEVIRDILFPAALSGILASFILAFSRAIGETMAVTLAAGSTPQITLNPFDSIQTMTAYIAQTSMGDTPHGTIEYQSIFAVGIVLFFMTLAMNLLSFFIVKKFRRKYE